jgi:hypothetical protein
MRRTRPCLSLTYLEVGEGRKNLQAARGQEIQPHFYFAPAGLLELIQVSPHNYHPGFLHVRSDTLEPKK